MMQAMLANTPPPLGSFWFECGIGTTLVCIRCIAAGMDDHCEVNPDGCNLKVVYQEGTDNENHEVPLNLKTAMYEIAERIKTSTN